jgi:hypothetical protein
MNKQINLITVQMLHNGDVEPRCNAVINKSLKKLIALKTKQNDDLCINLWTIKRYYSTTYLYK